MPPASCPGGLRRAGDPSSLDHERSDPGMGGGARGRPSPQRRPIDRESHGRQVAGGTYVSPRGRGGFFSLPLGTRRPHDVGPATQARPRRACSPGLASGDFAASCDSSLGTVRSPTGGAVLAKSVPRDGSARELERRPCPYPGNAKGDGGEYRGGAPPGRLPRYRSLWSGMVSVVLARLGEVLLRHTPGATPPAPGVVPVRARPD